MSHLESSTTGGSAGYKEPAIIKFIGEVIEEWEECDLSDESLWNCLHDDLEKITEEQIATVPTSHLQYLWDVLRYHGVYVTRDYHIPLYKTIFNVIHKEPEQWTHDEILEYLKTTGNFKSRRINRYLWENDIPPSKITPRKQTNPFLHPAITEKPPESRTPTPTNRTPNQTPTPSRTPTPIPGTTTPPAMQTPKSPPNDLYDNPLSQPQNRIPNPSSRTNPQTQSITPTEELGKEPETEFESGNQNDPDSGTTGSLATPGKMYANNNKQSNQKDNDENRNCDNLPRTNAKNNGKPILQSIQELLTEFRQSRQLPNRTNTRPIATPTPEAVANPTTPQIPTTTPKGATSLTTPPTSIPTRNKESPVYYNDEKTQIDTAKALEIVSIINSVLGLEGTAESLTARVNTRNALEIISKITAALGSEITTESPGNNPPLKELTDINKTKAKLTGWTKEGRMRKGALHSEGLTESPQCVNDVITPIPLPLFSPVRSTVPLSRNRGSATRIGGKHKDKVLYRGIGGV
jgi:hypothetical protein